MPPLSPENEEAVLSGRVVLFYNLNIPQPRERKITKKKAQKFRKAMLSDSADGLFLEKHLPTVKSFFNNPTLHLKIKSVSSI